MELFSDITTDLNTNAHRKHLPVCRALGQHPQPTFTAPQTTLTKTQLSVQLHDIKFLRLISAEGAEMHISSDTKRNQYSESNGVLEKKISVTKRLLDPIHAAF